MKIPKLGHVYKVICDVPAERVVCVGKTTQPLQERLVHHWTVQKKPTALNKFINEVGKEHFRIEALFESSDPVELSNQEEYWILKLNCIEQGFNKRVGTKLTEIDKQQACLTNYRNRAVICDNDNNCFISCSQAARHYRLNCSDVSECCARKLRQVKGFRFRYADLDKALYSSYWATGIYRNRKVTCVETGLCWGSVYEASKATSLARSAINLALRRGTADSRMGYHFRYLEQF